jgi:hypothetical protein
MLSQKDKEWIRKAIQEEFKEALLCKAIQEEFKEALLCNITVEKAPRKPDDIEKHYETEEINVLHFLARYLPFVEGAIRGIQEDANKTNNSISGLPEKLELISNILIDNKDVTIKLAQFIKMLEDNKILLTQSNPQLIEHESDN